MNPERKKIDKIYSQIDKIASVGKDNFLEYYKYIDDSIAKSDYNNLLQCLYYYYNIDIENLVTLEDIKKKTWNDIRLLTKQPLLKRIKKLYDKKGVYQVSFEVYNTSDNLHLGTLNEVDDFNDETKYYLKNRQFSRIMKTRRNYLEVSVVGVTQSVVLDDYNYNLSDDDNMYNKYATAVDLLVLRR